MRCRTKPRQPSTIRVQSLRTILSSSETQSAFSFHTINLSLDYKRTFDKEDRELDIGIHTSTDHNNFNSVNTQFNQPVGYCLLWNE